MDNRTPVWTLVTVQLLYGLLPTAGKVVFQDLSPGAVTSIRVIASAIALFVVWAVWRGVTWPDAKQWPGLIVLALLGIVINQGLFILGLERTEPVNATLLITTIPVFTYAAAVATGKETIGPRRAAGIAMGLFGAMYLVGLSRFEAGWDNAIGDMLILLNAVSFSLFLVFSKPWTERHSAFDLNVWLFLIAAVIFLPIGYFAGTGAQANGASDATWLWMAFIVLGPTVGAYVLNATALRKVPSSTVAVFIYLQPVISATAAWIVLSSAPSWRLLPSVVLIFTGVWLVSRKRPKVLEGDTVQG